MSETQEFSAPNEPIRHTYPLSNKNEGLFPALGLCLKTIPYILMRTGVMLGFAFAVMIWLAICGGIAALFSGKNGGGGGALFFILGVGIPLGVFVWLKNYMLYLLKAGHIAVLTKLITEGALPSGVNQVEYGKSIVREKFAQTNVMFVLDSLITGTAQAFNRTLDWIASLLPIPGMEGLMQIVNRIVDAATTYIDETIFSYNLARNDKNVWRSSMDGLIYYAQNVKAILKTAVWVVVYDYVLSFLIFLVCLAPAYLISKILPAQVSGYSWVFALIFAYTVRAAFLQPLFLTMVAICFHKNVHQQAINADMESVLSNASSKFQELTQKAKEWVTPAPQVGEGANAN